MEDKKNKILFAVLAVAFILSVVGINVLDTGSSGSSSSTWEGNTETFSFWMYKSVDSSYYASYNDNPALKYMTANRGWGENNTRIAFDFWVPPAGTATDNYSNMIGSGDYADVIQNTIGETPLKQYQKGISLDLTEYVKQYMPNYLAYLEAHPDAREKAVTEIDGEEHYLSIVSFYTKSPDQYWGHMYRRDWIVKYGINPVTGEAFTGGYTTEGDPDSWEDDVVFPSGGSDPVYISDWEWMFEIFEKAMAAEGITDSYCYSVPYNGFLAIGEVSASFGGACSGTFARTPENTVLFGPVTDQFRVYLECMANWYQKGWLDQKFNQRTSDMFYGIDSTNVYQGKVGMWYGLNSQLGGRMDDGSDLLKGICAYPAATPINDIYGSDAEKYQTPYASYATGIKNTDILISTKAKDKDIPALLSFFDYLYSEEGSLLVSFGMNTEQAAESNDPVMEKFGMSGGAYTLTEDGTVVVCDVIQGNMDYLGVSGARQMPGLYRETKVDYGYRGVYARGMELWASFENIGYIQGVFSQYMDESESKQYDKVNNKIGDYMNVHVPEFIMGKTDPADDATWSDWVKIMGKYGYEKVLKILEPIAEAHPYVSSDEGGE